MNCRTVKLLPALLYECTLPVFTSLQTSTVHNVLVSTSTWIKSFLSYSMVPKAGACFCYRCILFEKMATQYFETISEKMCFSSLNNIRLSRDFHMKCDNIKHPSIISETIESILVFGFFPDLMIRCKKHDNLQGQSDDQLSRKAELGMRSNKSKSQ